MGNARAPHIVHALNIAAHFPSPHQSFCIYLRPFSPLLPSLEVVLTRAVRAVTDWFERSRYALTARMPMWLADSERQA